jgi:hypothetical protein
LSGCLLLAAGGSFPGAASAAVEFRRDIAPLFAERCLECHGPGEQKAGLRLDRRENAVAEAIVPGAPDAGSLLARVTHADPEERMPPEGPPLSPDEVSRLREWIAAGAPWSGPWAFEPLRPEAPPEDGSAAAEPHPVDRFVRARLRREGLAPSPEADRHTLAKRLFYDLLGLPPDPARADAFARDSSPDAYERLVDELLASPRFGERWGRHWLDLARYADSDGYEKDRPRPTAWRYRDWVIDAVNRDLPLDRFTEEQLAGDLLPDAGDAQRLATAFHRQTLTNTEGGVDPEEFRVEAVFDRTETTGAVWLGLTVGCARCHDHKYDALTQRDYFGLYAFFNNADETTAAMPLDGTAPAQEPASPPAPDAKSRQDFAVAVLAERTASRRVTRILERGDFLSPGEPVAPAGFPFLPPLRSRHPADAEPDRLDLARWLMDGENPLPPRVFANRIWMRLFGSGLVPTADDFGVRGEPPTHPELLDWLAGELVRGGWSRKHLIRTIVTSATYRQRADLRPDLASADPRNRLLARQNRLRVEGEIVRDLALAVSGLLDDRVGGPSVFPPLPGDVAALSYANNFKWVPSTGPDRYRRGMYTFFKRTAPHPNLAVFDCPDANTAALARSVSNTPTQALTLLNEESFVEAAQALAARFVLAPGDDAARLEALLRAVLVRPLARSETQRFRSLLETSRQSFAARPEDAARFGGPHRPEPVPPAEFASWTSVARIALNLDEFLTRD